MTDRLPAEPDPWAAPAGPQSGVSQGGGLHRKPFAATVRTAGPVGSVASKVRLVGVELPFWPLVKLLLKIAVAAIPALLLLVLVFVLVLGGLLMTGVLLGLELVTGITDLLSAYLHEADIPWF